MAEYNMIMVSSERKLLTYIPTETKFFLYNNVDIVSTRIQKSFTEKMIVPILPLLEDENGNPLEFRKETREWDMVLPFGNDSKTPRRTPTEAIYKGKKLRNSFM